MKHLARISLLFVLLAVWHASNLGAQGPVVRAVLFFSPTCPHCHQVINEVLPGIFRRFGGEARVHFDQNLPRDQIAYYLVSNGQLEILLVDASVARGNRLYVASQEALDIPANRRGVPRLVVRDSVLVGSLEIPQIFPRIIEAGLATGGIDWPEIAGLDESLSAFPFLQPLAAAEDGGAEGVEPGADTESRSDPGAAAVPDRDEPEREPEASAAVPMTSGAREDSSAVPGSADKTPEAEEDAAAAEPTPGTADLSTVSVRRPGMIELYQRDPVGNSFSVLVILGMLVSLFAVYGMSQRRVGAGGELGSSVPMLALLGIVVAGYLAYIESTGAEAVCGPVGDCNTVNQSEYAVLFGVLPVGVLGLVGYVAIIAAWLTARRGSGAASDWAKVALLGMTLAGTLFSVYLTFLEPFVIGATCAWCLTSAVVMTLLMLMTARPAFGAIDRLRAT